MPDHSRWTRGQNVSVGSLDETSLDLHVGVHDAVEQVIRTQHLHFSDGTYGLRPNTLRYAWPAELDAMALVAGLRRSHRWADWAGNPFNAASTAHVSVCTQCTGRLVNVDSSGPVGRTVLRSRRAPDVPGVQRGRRRLVQQAHPHGGDACLRRPHRAWIRSARRELLHDSCSADRWQGLLHQPQLLLRPAGDQSPSATRSPSATARPSSPPTTRSDRHDRREAVVANRS